MTSARGLSKLGSGAEGRILVVVSLSVCVSGNENKLRETDNKFKIMNLLVTGNEFIGKGEKLPKILYLIFLALYGHILLLLMHHLGLFACFRKSFLQTWRGICIFHEESCGIHDLTPFPQLRVPMYVWETSHLFLWSALMNRFWGTMLLLCLQGRVMGQAYSLSINISRAWDYWKMTNSQAGKENMKTDAIEGQPRFLFILQWPEEIYIGKTLLPPGLNVMNFPRFLFSLKEKGPRLQK